MKAIVLTLALGLFSGIFSSNAQAQVNNVCTPLYAGQHILVGELCVEKVFNDLHVTYTTTGGWTLQETHLSVAMMKEEIQNWPNRPAPGQLDYNGVNYGLVPGVTSFTFIVDLGQFPDYACPDQLALAAHATVSNSDLGQTETAWAYGQDEFDTSWGWFWEFTVPCDDDLPGGQRGCETAFAYNDGTSFVDLGLARRRWGWVVPIDEETSGSRTIYAGAGNNVLSNGYPVGTMNYAYFGGTLTVEYVAYPGYGFDEAHLYASKKLPRKLAPGRYGNTQDSLGHTSYVNYTLYGLNGSLYLIGHSVACSDAE